MLSRMQRWYVRVVLSPLFVIFMSSFLCAGQRLDFLEKCPAVHCPVDCKTVFGERSENVQCPFCSCPLGQRCPSVVCPPNRINSRCTTPQKMDGCLTCVCDEPVYSVFNSDNNVETYLLGKAAPGSQRTCQHEDMRKIRRCTSGVMDLHDALRLARPELGSPLHAWYKMRRRELREFCAVLRTVPRCVGRDRATRCRYQHPQLDFLHTMFGFPCLESPVEFFGQFDCVANVLNAHGRMRYCQQRADKEYAASAATERTRRRLSVAVKQRRKCESVNRYLDCVKPTLKLFCGRVAAMIFHETLIKASPYIAPECRLSAAGRLSPLPLNGHSSVPLEQRLVVTKSSRKGSQLQLKSEGRADLTDELNRMLTLDLDTDRDRRSFPGLVVRLPTGDFEREQSVGCASRITRTQCPGGKVPMVVARWYRPPGSPACVSYQYAYCNSKLAESDGAIRYEDECYDLCFSPSELILRRFLNTRRRFARFT